MFRLFAWNRKDKPLAKGLSFLFQANNLNNAEFVRYKDVPTNVIERTTYGKTYLFGMNYKY